MQRFYKSLRLTQSGLQGVIDLYRSRACQYSFPSNERVSRRTMWRDDAPYRQILITREEKTIRGEAQP